MVKAFDAALEKLLNDTQKDEKKATIFLSTTGGSVLDGDAIAERIWLASKFVDLRIVAMTYVMSAGVRIFLSLPRDRRHISPAAIIMVHPMGIGCDAVSKQSTDERIRRLSEELLEANHTKRREEKWIRAFAKEIGKDYKVTKELWRKSHRFTAKEAVELGLASSIIR